jgi:hypothetical protein
MTEKLIKLISKFPKNILFQYNIRSISSYKELNFGDIIIITYFDNTTKRLTDGELIVELEKILQLLKKKLEKILKDY